MKTVQLHMTQEVILDPPVVLPLDQAKYMASRGHVLAVKRVAFVDGYYIVLAHSRVTKSGTLYNETNTSSVVLPTVIAAAVNLLGVRDAWMEHHVQWDAVKATAKYRDTY